MPDVTNIPIDSRIHARFKATVALRRDGSMKQTLEGLIIAYVEDAEREARSPIVANQTQ